MSVSEPLVPVERWAKRDARDVRLNDHVRTWDSQPFTVTRIDELPAQGLLRFWCGGIQHYVNPTEEVDVLIVEHVADDEVWCGDCGRVLVLDNRGHPTRCDFCDGKDASL